MVSWEIFRYRSKWQALLCVGRKTLGTPEAIAAEEGGEQEEMNRSLREILGTPFL